MDALQIVDWNANFENNRTREMKSMAWVPIPNKMDGDGFTELVDHPQGAAHYGAWMAIVLTASRCGERGTLLRSTGKPHDSASLSRISRIPAKVFDEAIPRLEKIGWLRRKSLPDMESHDAAEIPQASAVVGAPCRDGTERKERNGTEEKEPPKAPQGASAFDAFWAVVHEKVGKGHAERQYAKAVKRLSLREADPHAFLIERMTAFAASPSAKPPDRSPIHPATWLSHGRYDDDPATWHVVRGSQAKAFVKLGASHVYDPNTVTRNEI